MKPGDIVRLKDLYNVRITCAEPLCGEYIGNDMAVLKQGAKIVHWAPLDGVPDAGNRPRRRIPWHRGAGHKE